MKTVSAKSSYCSGDYQWAVLHVAWWLHEKDRELVLGFVELVPSESPKPIAFDEISCRTDKIVKRSSLWYMRYVMPAQEALKWYEKALTGEAGYPVKEGEKFHISDMEQTTIWPSSTLIDADSDEYPFLPVTWNVRVHSTFPVTLSEKLKTVASHSKYEEWLSDQFLFSFEEFPLYWGSIHCAFPNPVLRSINCTRGVLTDGAETVDIELVARRGMDIGSLTLIHEEQTASGINSLQIVPVSTPYTRIVLDRKIGEVKTSVTCSQRGLIAQEGPYPFLRGFNIQMDIHGGSKKVEVPSGGKRKPKEEYQVPIVSGERINSIIADEKESDGLSLEQKILRERRKRDTRKKAADLGQRWLHGNPSEAREFLRKVIGGARKRVWIVDPYFAVREYFLYVHAVQRSEVDIRIFSSVEALKKRSVIDGVRDVAEGELLFKQLQHTKEKMPNNIEVKLMTGVRPEIHDRFLVIDDLVWFSGISLNEIGERAAIMMKLPNPDPVIHEIELIWNHAERSKKLEEWLETRGEEKCQKSTIFQRLMSKLKKLKVYLARPN